MKKALHFDGGEIVRLKGDHPDYELRAGDCGLVWGVYHVDPPLYEASFVNPSCEFIDMMFREVEVGKLTNLSEAPFIEQLESLRRMLENY